MTFSPSFTRAEFLLKDFQFENGQTITELRQHYLTCGTPQRDHSGSISNAVLLLHNTTGSSEDWLAEELGGQLFGAGAPLDAAKFFSVIPDCIGFGKSSKPSNGLRARFPNYRYADMVNAQRQLLTEGLGVGHLRLVLGLSMGGMLTWLWAITHPTFMDGLVPIACQPGPMSGRNWLQRRMAIEAIRNDPEWNGGDYTRPPTYYSRMPIGAIFTQSVLRLQDMAPTREAADALYRKMVERARNGDANDRLYQLEASMDYDPRDRLDQISAPVLAINFADDELNPPELGVLEQAMSRLRRGRYIITPADASSRGHYSAQQASRWQQHLENFIRDELAA
jgi:homoserine O-acetyltransferase/O-succinyltransferase